MVDLHPFKRIEEIYETYYTYLKNFLMGLTKDEQVADDVIQELFAKILKQPTLLKSVTHMKSWLLKGAKNTLLDYYKKKKPELLNEDDTIEHLLIYNQTPEMRTVWNDQLDSIFNQLNRTDQLILLAKLHYGYDYQEISELLEIPVSTLKSKVFRIRKQLVKERWKYEE
ncbi:RNA polymerase sigma factor [Halobacillus litoralis]|uniref:RNA polymerase sigma factor n=1 Tax=Halobacillus litoralis TaxID=45668 RepID=UPI001CD3D953|nr:RNA polymerase sigma factor [Halobacillus litoralis]MCA0971417.1 RNA polymerase sigma factor [Halobacillus litoralis]